MYWGMMDGWGWAAGMGFVGWLLRIVFWIIVIWIIIWLVRRGRPCGGGERGRAMDILKERYAKGEITKEQFEDMKKDVM